MADFRFSSKTTKQLGLAISVVVAPFLIYGLIWELPHHQANQMKSKEKFDAEQAARVGWIQGLGAVFAAGTAVITWKTYQENQKNAERNFQALQEKQDRDAAHAEKNLQALLEKNTADRFSKAIEQLGNKDSIHVRLGGIFALEQIANTEDKYYGQIMEILTAYVRERSPWPEKEDKKRQVDPETGEVSKLAEDIQAVMTVLARRKNQPTPRNVFALDLRGTDLRNLYLLPNSNLNLVDLENSNLSGAVLEGVNFEGSRFDNARIQNAKLQGANLKKARLWKTSLNGSDLQEANLYRASLRLAYLQAVKSTAKVTKVNLSNAILERADLTGADLTGADLTEANLKKTQLIYTKLNDINMLMVNLEGAKLGQTCVKGTDFSHARNLSREQKDQIQNAQKTPSGLTT